MKKTSVCSDLQEDLHRPHKVTLTNDQQLLSFQEKYTEIYERQRRMWLCTNGTQEEYDEHIIEELEHEYLDHLEKEWRETLELPTEEDLIAENPKLLTVVRSARRELKKTVEAESEHIISQIRWIKKNSPDEFTTYFCELYLEHIIYPATEAKEKRLWQLGRHLPRRKNAKVDDFPLLLDRARQVPIVTEIEKYLRIMKCGSKYKALCPFHDEKTASFYIYPDSNSFYCFGCTIGGDTIKFKQLIDGLSFREAVSELTK